MLLFGRISQSTSRPPARKFSRTTNATITKHSTRPSENPTDEPTIHPVEPTVQPRRTHVLAPRTHTSASLNEPKKEECHNEPDFHQIQTTYAGRKPNQKPIEPSTGRRRTGAEPPLRPSLTHRYISGLVPAHREFNVQKGNAAPRDATSNHCDRAGQPAR